MNWKIKSYLKDFELFVAVNKKTILVVLGGGGHTRQLLELVRRLGKRYSYEYLSASDDNLSEKMIELKGPLFKIFNPRKMEDKNILKVILKFIPSTMQLFFVFLKSKSDCILCAGPALSLHVAFLGKFLFRKKVIFLESWSRVYSKSLAGRFTYPFADLSFVQWLQERKNYPQAIYAGRLG
jgi:UDP-N-acetylglucosamine:LPS N-acetylglucosamine transferase